MAAEVAPRDKGSAWVMISCLALAADAEEEALGFLSSLAVFGRLGAGMVAFLAVMQCVVL